MRTFCLTLILLCLSWSLSAQNKKTLTAGVGLGYATGLNAVMLSAEAQYFFKKNLGLRVGVDYAEDRLTVADGEIRYVYLTNYWMLNAELVKSVELLNLLQLYGFAGVRIVRAADYVHDTQVASGLFPGLSAGAGVAFTALPLIKPFVQLRGAYIPGEFNYQRLHHLAITAGVRFQLQEGD